MPHPIVRAFAVSLLITAALGVHAIAKLIVQYGFGIVALALLFASLPLLSRYLD